MEFHEAANIFPLNEKSIPALAEDIEANGQERPIHVMGGKILDGRRRFLACQMLGVEPKTEEVNPEDPVAHVLSFNNYRHLTEREREVLASRPDVYAVYKKQAEERERAGKGVDGSGGRGNKKNPGDDCPDGLPRGRADNLAGDRFAIAGKAVQHARKIRKDGIPELVSLWEAGQVKCATSTAAHKAGQQPAEQKAFVERQIAKAKEKEERKKGGRKPESNGVEEKPKQKNQDGESKAIRQLIKAAKEIYQGPLKRELDRLGRLLGADRATYAPDLLAGAARVIRGEIKKLFTLLRAIPGGEPEHKAPAEAAVSN